MTNRVILTTVDADVVLEASTANKAVPFAVTQNGDVTQLAMSVDGTADGVNKYPIGAFPAVSLVTIPEITFPLDGATVSPIMELTTAPWSHLYRRAMAKMTLEVATDPAFSDTVFTKDITDGTESYRFKLHELPGETILYIRVYKEEQSPYGGVPEGAWSATISVTTLEAPYIRKPVVTVSNENDGITDNPPQFRSSEFSFVGVYEQTHISTVWRLTDINTGIVTEKTVPYTGDTGDLDITWDRLEFNQRCTISCKHTGDTLYDSDWADPVLFVLEDAPRTLEPVITYPVHGALGIAPYTMVVTEPMATNRPNPAPVAARYRVYAGSTLITDTVLKLNTYTETINWVADTSTITNTVTVTSVADLYKLDVGVLSYLHLSSTLHVEAWHVDAVLGPSANAAGIEQSAISSAVITPTLYTGGITSPINGAADVQLSPQITNNITPISWTIPVKGVFKDTLSTQLVLRNITGGASTIHWSKTNVSGSEPVTPSLAIKSSYSITAIITSTTQSIWSDTISTTFATINELVPLMVVNGNAIQYPANGNAVEEYPTFRVPSASLFNIDFIPDAKVTVVWELYNYSTGALLAQNSSVVNTTNQTTSTYYTWYSGQSLRQNTAYTLRVKYTTNHPTELPTQGWFTSNFYVPNIKIRNPLVTTNGPDGSIKVKADGVSNAAYLTYAPPIKVIIQAYTNMSKTTYIGGHVQWLANYNSSAIVSASDLGCAYGNTYYICAAIWSDNSTLVEDSSDTWGYISTSYSRPQSSTLTITAPQSYSTVTSESMPISIAGPEGRPVKWSSAIKGNDPTSYASQPFAYGYIAGNTTTKYEVQISRDIYFNSIDYTTTVTVSTYNPTTSGTAFLWTDSGGTPSGTSSYYWGNGSEPYETGFAALGYISGTSRVRTGSVVSAPISNPVLTPVSSGTVSVSSSVLPSGTYYIRARDIVTTTKASGQTMTTTYDWSGGRGPITFTSKAAKQWGGVFKPYAETSTYMQGSYGNAGLIWATDVGYYNLGMYSITDSISQSRIYRTSGRWYFSFTPSDCYIGVVSNGASIEPSYGAISGAGVMWAIPPTAPLSSIINTNLIAITSTTGYTTIDDGQSYPNYRYQGSDDWWAVIDLDVGQVELYDPNGGNAVNFRIKGWSSGMSMTLAISSFDYAVSRTIGERARVFYDTVKVSPYAFSTVQTNLTF